MCRGIPSVSQELKTCLIHPKLGHLRLGASVGVGCFPRDGADWAALLSVADQNMYQDKAERKLGRLIDTDQSQTRAA